MTYYVGKAIFHGKSCPVCKDWLIPRHILQCDLETSVEQEGFCLDDSKNVWVCATCHSRFYSLSEKFIQEVQKDMLVKKRRSK